VTRVRLRSGKLSIEMELRESPTSKALLAALPFEASAQTWGEEVYFTTPVSVKLEADARQVVEPGAVCFWTQGDALALPFGPTPISTDARPKLANPCNVLGSIVGDPGQLGAIRAGQKITVEKA
jgi:hypothetical protein